MNADGSHLEQITHFNEPGYPESQPKKTWPRSFNLSATDRNPLRP